MAIQYDLRTYLLADSTIEGLVGDRIYPIRAPELGVQSHVTYQVISDVPVGRPSGGPPHVHAVRIQFDVYAQAEDSVDGYAAARTLLAALAARMDGKRGSLGSGLESVQDIRVESQRDVVYDETTRLYQCSVDVTVYHAPA